MTSKDFIEKLLDEFMNEPPMNGLEVCEWARKALLEAMNHTADALRVEKVQGSAIETPLVYGSREGHNAAIQEVENKEKEYFA